MSAKTFTVRVPSGTQDINSDQVATWLDAQLASGAPLIADPGAGERTLRLSLDQDKVKAGAQAAGEPEAVFIRRLIATNVALPEEEKTPEAKARPKPPAPVLKGVARLSAEQVRPFIEMVDAGQAVALGRAFRLPADASPYLRYSPEERDDLAGLGAEVLNRRAPAFVVANADLLGFATKFIAVETDKIGKARAIAEQLRGHQQRQPVDTPEPGPSGYEVQQ